MAEYTAATVITLIGAVLAAEARGVLRERAVIAGALVFGAATVVADLLLTGLPIVTYGDELRSGWSIGPMPIEDLGYGLALYLVAAAVWGRPRRRSGPSREAAR
jgi:lycopene cyclase domain-containing protein